MRNPSAHELFSRPMPRLVLFDIGNVLIMLNPIDAAFPMDGLPESAGRLGAEKLLGDFKQCDVFQRFERGLATVGEFCEALRGAFHVSLSDEEIATCYARILGAENEGMLCLINDLKRRGVRVAGLSDTSPIHLEAMMAYPVVQALEEVVASCVTGRKKPERETFLDALRRLDADPIETYFTDDLLLNVEGARQAGIRAEVFSSVDRLRISLGV